jgi:spore coat protein CotH
VIQENFDVQQVATYFAVNMVLSHWDGFFNNYLAYHDSKRNKWMMFPGDQDKTWGYYDGLPDDQVFFDMPLTFGMAGDRPPGVQGNRGAGGGGGGFGGFGGRGAMWWRQGGPFSQPLLANPQFRKVFLTRTREILERVYTQEIYFPLIDQMATRLGEDVAIRARLRGEDAAAGAKLLARDTDLLKTHLSKRRQFLLEQKELQAVAAEPKP